MDWSLLVMATLVGAGLFVAVRAAFAGQSNTDGVDQLERMAQAQAQATAFPSLQQVAPVELGSASAKEVLRRWLDKRVSNSGRFAQLATHTAKLSDVLDRADLRLRPIEWYAIQIGAGVAVAAILSIRFNIYVGLVAMLLLPNIVGSLYLRRRVSKRLKQVDAQLSDVLVQMCNGLRAGYSFAQALSSVAAQARAPLGRDLTRVRTEMGLGVPVDEALHHLAVRVPTEDIDLFVTAVGVTRVLGGNLAAILSVIAATVRERVKIQSEIRTLTAQARASGIIVTLLPFGLAGILTLIAPDYFQRMYSDPIGIGMMFGCIVSMAAGGLIIKKIVTIDV